MTETVGFAVEELRLAGEPEIVERRALALAEIGADHSLRLADQEGMPEAFEIVVTDRPGHVVPHVLLIPDGRTVGGRSAQIAHDAPPVAVHLSDRFFAHRM